MAVLGACGSGGSSGKTVSVRLQPGSAAKLVLSDGGTVTIPKGAVSQSATLTGKAVSKPPAKSTELTAFAGPTYDLQLDNGKLVRPISVQLPADRTPKLAKGAAAPLDVALFVVYDPTSKKWTPSPGQTYDVKTKSVTAPAPHLSFRSTLRLDTSGFVDIAKSLIAKWTGSADLPNPTCPDEKGLKSAGTNVISDKGDLVKWCAGQGNGKTVIRVANNRQYPLQFNYSPTWTAKSTGDYESIFTVLTRNLGRWLTPAPPGYATAIIPAGGVEEFTAPAGTFFRLEADPSSGTYLVEAMLYGIDTLAMTMGEIPGGPEVSTDTTTKVIEAMVHSPHCVDALQRISRTIPDDAAGVGKILRADIDIALDCLGEQWKICYGKSGLLGTFLVGAYLWVLQGEHLILEGARAIFDTAVYWRSYRIVASSATSTLSQLGQQECLKNGNSTDPCNGPVPANLSTVDAHYGFAGPGRDGYAGAVFRRSSTTSDDWNVLMVIGGAAIDCSHQPAPSAVLQQFDICMNPAPESSATTAISDDADPQQVMNAFLAAWLRGDVGTEQRYASAEAIAALPSNPGSYRSADLRWSLPTCVLGSSGAGGCPFTLTSKSGQTSSFTALYHYDVANDRIAIDQIDAAAPSGPRTQPPCTNDGPCSYPIDGGGSSINLRSSPSTSASIVRSIPDGTVVTVMCSVNGETVTALR